MPRKREHVCGILGGGCHQQCCLPSPCDSQQPILVGCRGHQAEGSGLWTFIHCNCIPLLPAVPSLAATHAELILVLLGHIIYHS